jgi:hypothetical protein
MATGIPDYDELKLRIEPGAEGAYRVLASGPEGATASGSFVAPFTRTELDIFVLRVGLPRRAVRSFGSSQMEDAKRFGSRLFDALVQQDVRDAYLASRRAADAHDRGLRVTLQLTNVPELMEIPWEFLYERPRFLSQSIYTPVVRSLDLKTVRPPRQLTLPLRILGVVSSPNGFETLDVANERRKLEQALSTLIAEDLVELTWLGRATMSELDRAVGAPDELHVIHYIGHGAFDERAEGGLLVLEDSRGNAHEVTGEEFASLLQDERSLGLAVLNACEGARTSHVDPFSGVASSLVECGIPAVIGMQFEVTDEAAIAFAERLYSALAQGFPVDAALAQARRAIFTAGNDIEFGTPVLFLRSGATRLFEIDAAGPRRTAAGPPLPESPPPETMPPETMPPETPPSETPRPGAPSAPLPPKVSDYFPHIPVDRISGQLDAWDRRAYRKALKRVPETLEAGEIVHAVDAGSRPGDGVFATSGLILLTDRRLLFVARSDDGDVVISLGDIGSVVTSPAALRTVEVTVVHGERTTVISCNGRKKGEELVTLLRRAAGEASLGGRKAEG